MHLSHTNGKFEIGAIESYNLKFKHSNDSSIEMSNESVVCRHCMYKAVHF